MKKAFVLLLALVMVGALFAEGEAKAAYTLSGDASVKWGFDLGTKKSGFVNDANFAIEFPIAAGVTATKSGEDVYGKLTITDINLSVKDSKDDGIQTLNVDADDNSFDIDAKIIAGALTVDFYGTPSFTFNNAAYIEPWSKDEYDDWSSSKKSVLRATQTIGGGFGVSYAIGKLATVEGRVASIGNWAGTAAKDPETYDVLISDGTAQANGVGDYNMTGVLYAKDAVIPAGPYIHSSEAAAAVAADDRYLFAGMLTLTPIDMVKLVAGAMYYPDAKYLGLTGKLTLKPVTGLTVTAGMDAVKATSTADLKFDANGKVAFDFNEKKDSVAAEVYFADKNANGKAYARMDVGAKFTDASGFVDGLSVDAGLFYNDMLADPAADPAKLAIIEKISYKYALSDTNYVKPYEAFGTNLNGKTSYLNVGAEAGLITNVVFTLDYTFGKIADDVVGNAFITGASADIGKGVLSFKTKISL